jgi:hypothetical protein
VRDQITRRKVTSRRLKWRHNAIIMKFRR